MKKTRGGVTLYFNCLYKKKKKIEIHCGILYDHYYIECMVRNSIVTVTLPLFWKFCYNATSIPFFHFLSLLPLSFSIYVYLYLFFPRPSCWIRDSWYDEKRIKRFSFIIAIFVCLFISSPLFYLYRIYLTIYYRSIPVGKRHGRSR